MKRLLILSGVFFSSLAHAQMPVIDQSKLPAFVDSLSALAASIPKADPVPAGQEVSDGKVRATRDGRLVMCDSTGQAFDVTTNGGMVIQDPEWKAGKPVKCRRDMFVGLFK
jgi:hypothetical protein